MSISASKSNFKKEYKNISNQRYQIIVEIFGNHELMINWMMRAMALIIVKEFSSENVTRKLIDYDSCIGPHFPIAEIL